MKIDVVLADKGTNNPAQGTLNLLNAGWVQTQLTPSPLAGGQLITSPHIVVVFMEIEAARCNRPLELVIALLNEDGRPVEMPTPQGPQPVRVSSLVTIPSPAMAPIGAAGTGSAMIDIFPGLLVNPGTYRWSVSLDGEQHEEWYAVFRVLAAPQLPTFNFGASAAPEPPLQPPPDVPPAAPPTA